MATSCLQGTVAAAHSGQLKSHALVAWLHLAGEDKEGSHWLSAQDNPGVSVAMFGHCIYTCSTTYTPGRHYSHYIHTSCTTTCEAPGAVGGT
jgi:hypothetical protein